MLTEDKTMKLHPLINFKTLVKKQETIEKEIRHLPIVKQFLKIGFSIIYYRNNSFGFIKYEHKKIDGKYYSISFRKGILEKERNDVTDEDFEMVKQLLESSSEKPNNS